MEEEWYLSCPHACYDPDTCPYGRNHLPKIEALLRKVERLNSQLEAYKRMERRLVEKERA